MLATAQGVDVCQILIQEKSLKIDNSWFEQPKSTSNAIHQIEFVGQLKYNDNINCNQFMSVLTILEKIKEARLSNSSQQKITV